MAATTTVSSTTFSTALRKKASDHSRSHDTSSSRAIDTGNKTVRFDFANTSNDRTMKGRKDMDAIDIIHDGEMNHVPENGHDYGDDDDDEDDDDVMGIGGSDDTSRKDIINQAIPTHRQIREAKRQRRSLQQQEQTKAAQEDEEELDWKEAYNDSEAKRERNSAALNEKTTRDVTDDRSLMAEGIRVEPFHMKNEQSNGMGYFVGDTYVFRQRRKRRRTQQATEDGDEDDDDDDDGDDDDDNQEPDAWLDLIKYQQRKEHADARTTASVQPSHNDENRLDSSEEKNTDNRIHVHSNSSSNSERFDQLSETELYARILPILNESETVSQAIIRYGKFRSRKANSYKTSAPATAITTSATTVGIEDGKANRNIANTNVTQSAAVAVDPVQQMAQDSLQELTSLSSAVLLLQGRVDIYQMTRKDLLRCLSRHDTLDGKTSAVTVASTTSRETPSERDIRNNRTNRWEYQGRSDGQIHGPYTTQEMMQWIHAGYFIGDAVVYVRLVTTSTTLPADEVSSSDTKTEQYTSAKDELLNDLFEEEDAANDNADTCGTTRSLPRRNGDGGKVPVMPQETRGDWIRSDQIDFLQYM